MKLEQQLTSLSLSKRLKELGVPQDSLFWWVDWSAEQHPEGSHGWYLENSPHYKGCESISAYTVAELGELLPSYITEVHTAETCQDFHSDVSGVGQYRKWACWYGQHTNPSYQIQHNEAETRGMLLEHLLTHSRITI